MISLKVSPWDDYLRKTGSEKHTRGGTMEKITIEPVTRIEGHAKVTIHLNDQGKVDRAYLHVNEWRGFEKFTEGRPFFEMPQITPRICGICPVSHHLTSAMACDQIIGAVPPRPAQPLEGADAYGAVHSIPRHAFL